MVNLLEDRMSRNRKRAILANMARLPDWLEAKLYDLLQAKQQGHAYMTGPGQAKRACKALEELEKRCLAYQQSSLRPGVSRWRISPLGEAYFDRNEQHHAPAPPVIPRTAMLLARVQASKDRGQVFTTSPESYYEDELKALRDRGYVRGRFLTRGKKAGRMSWTVTEAGHDYLRGLSALR